MLLFYCLVLVFFEWTIFMFYVSVNVSTFSLVDEPGNKLKESKNRNLTVALKPTAIQGKNFLKGRLNLTIKHENILKFSRTTEANLTNSQNCTLKSVKLTKTPLPVTGLVGFPGSGSTWLRHLVQQMTGIGTSSMYCDRALRRQGFPFECTPEKNKGIILVKTHEEKHFKVFEKIVLLLRNPYEAFLAYFSFLKRGHTGQATIEVLKQVNDNMFNLSLWWYTDLANGTLTRFKGPVHLVQYERLKTNMADELEKLATFLGVNVSKNDISCTVELQEGNFHRKTNNITRQETLRTLFDKEQLLQMNKATDIVGKLLKEKLNLDVDVGGSAEKILLEKHDNTENKSADKTVTLIDFLTY